MPRTRYRPIYYFPRAHGLPILLDFHTLHVHQDQDLVVLNTTDMEPARDATATKSTLSANSEAIHF